MNKLDPGLHQRITRFCEIGDDLAAQGDFLQAVDSYRYAQQLLPAPQAQWQAATWIAAAVADAYFFAGLFAKAVGVLQQALDEDFSTAAENPFIHLRLGQSLHELGRGEAAQAAVLTALRLGGREILNDEAEKYRDFFAECLALMPPAL